MVKNSFQSQLFIGFLVNTNFQKELDLINNEVKSIFIEKEGYLDQYLSKNGLFLGKFIENSTNLANLELISLNVMSLLKRVVPNYPYNISDLLIMPVFKD